MSQRETEEEEEEEEKKKKRSMRCIFVMCESSTGSISTHPKPPFICPSLYLSSIRPPSQFNKRRKLPRMLPGRGGWWWRGEGLQQTM